MCATCPIPDHNSGAPGHRMGRSRAVAPVVGADARKRPKARQMSLVHGGGLRWWLGRRGFGGLGADGGCGWSAIQHRRRGARAECAEKRGPPEVSGDSVSMIFTSDAIGLRWSIPPVLDQVLAARGDDPRRHREARADTLNETVAALLAMTAGRRHRNLPWRADVNGCRYDLEFSMAAIRHAGGRRYLSVKSKACMACPRAR
jgi:hypothetical protein